MNRRSIEKWCEQNSSTESRLEEGNWGAFAKKIIEIPVETQLTKSAEKERLIDLISGSVLIALGIIVAAIAIIISPLFLPVIIQRHKQRNSLTKNL